jgi:hypothetical protein
LQICKNKNKKDYEMKKTILKALIGVGLVFNVANADIYTNCTQQLEMFQISFDPLKGLIEAEPCGVETKVYLKEAKKEIYKAKYVCERISYTDKEAYSKVKPIIEDYINDIKEIEKILKGFCEQ